MASNKIGRPSSYTQEKADEICALLSMGQSIRTVCLPDHMPSLPTFFKWLRDNEEFLKQYTRAKEEAADAMAEDTLYISDTPQLGETRTLKADGTEEVKYEDMLGHRRLQIETRKWLMAKMKPRRYGDKLDLTSDGKALPAPLLGGVTIEEPKDA